MMDPFGDGLSILIQCQPRPVDTWLSFVSWYSIQKNLPDAKVALASPRPTSGQELGIFPWAYRLGIKPFYAADGLSVALSRGYLIKPVLVIPSGTVVTGVVPENLFESDSLLNGTEYVFDVKTEVPEWLIQVKESCGGFVMRRWIDRGGHPFRRTGAYQQGDLTVNERRMLSLWSQLCPIYDSIG